MSSEALKTRKKKITIAFLLRDLTGAAGLRIMGGIIEEAKNQNINIMTLFGNKLSGDMGNIIYDLINKNTIDGIVTWASSDSDDYLKYYNNYKGIPLVSLTLPLPGHPVIAIDTYKGMKEAMEHLIKHHGYKKIGFIRGPENHIYAKERYQAYLDALSENNIELDENLVTPPGDFTAESGIIGFKTLFIERRLKPKQNIEVVVSVADQMILGLMTELKKINVKIPEEIALVGYNNTDLGIGSKPAITSVSMPFNEQGKKAVQTLVDMINGKNVPSNIILESKLEILQSCGCQYSNVTNAAIRYSIKTVDATMMNCFKSKLKRSFLKEKQKEMPIDKILNDYFPQIFSLMESSIGDIKISKDSLNKMVNEFMISYLREVSKREENIFIKTLNTILFQTIENNGNVEAWHGALTSLRSVMLPYLIDYSTRMIATDLIDQGRVMLGEVIKQKYVSKVVAADAIIDLLRIIGINLTSVFKLSELKDVLLKRISSLNCNGVYLVLYEDPKTYKFPDPLPKNSNLFFAYTHNDGLFKSQDKGVKFETNSILPEEHLAKLDIFNFFVMPIYFIKSQIGYFIIDNGELDKKIYNLVRDQISGSLYSIKLFEELNDTRKELEITLDKLKSKAGLISSNSQHISDRVNDISTAMEESAANIREISYNINEVMKIVNNAVDMGKKVTSLIAELSQHSHQISNVTTVISDIAQQTNVLSLNASIEAARAGEAGKGFSIVAREIKDLSKKTVKSTDEITGMIKMIQSSTDLTVENMSNVIKVIEEIYKLSDIITSAIGQQSTVINSISNLLVEAATGTKEITNAIAEVADMGKV